MDWAGDGIVLTTRPHGESAAIIEVLTADLGLHRGVVRGGSGRRLTPVLQPGNTLALTWRARLDVIAPFVGDLALGFLADPAVGAMHRRLLARRLGGRARGRIPDMAGHAVDQVVETEPRLFLGPGL